MYNDNCIIEVKGSRTGAGYAGNDGVSRVVGAGLQTCQTEGKTCGEDKDPASAALVQVHHLQIPAHTLTQP